MNKIAQALKRHGIQIVVVPDEYSEGYFKVYAQDGMGHVDGSNILTDISTAKVGDAVVTLMAHVGYKLRYT